MSYALIFPGQTSQHPAMLPWLESEPAAAPILEAMCSVLGEDWRQTISDPHRRSENAFVQVLITGTALAAWSALKLCLSEPPAIIAGYSVGELPAFSCAGVISAEQALTLAAQRSALMDRAVAGHDTGLLSVAGVTEVAVLERCNGIGLECAIRIGEVHTIFGGSTAVLACALPLITSMGAVCKLLDVRVASHSSWMVSAAQNFSEVLGSVAFTPPHYPVAVNSTGAMCRQPGALRNALSLQLKSPVQWASCMETIAEHRISCVLEVGAGSALARIWNTRYKDIPARGLDDFQHLRSALEWVEKHANGYR